MASATGRRAGYVTAERSKLLHGQGGIRTLDTLTGIPVFETGSFSHSDTCPGPAQLLSGAKFTPLMPGFPVRGSAGRLARRLPARLERFAHAPEELVGGERLLEEAHA